jgi:hypothetical protein
MLKKIIALILCIASAICVIACGNIETQSTPLVTTDTDITDITTARTQGTWGSIGGGHSGGANTNQSFSYSYESFEENLREIDTIVRATFVTISYDGKDYIKYTFKVNEVLLGVAGETIDVLVRDNIGLVCTPDGRCIYFSEIDVFQDYNEAEAESEFLLMLNSTVSVYYNIPAHYGWQRGMIINLDYIHKSEMYNEPLAYHATGIDINNCTKEELIDYVCELTKDNEPEEVLSKAETLEEIVNESDMIFHVKVKELFYAARTDIVEKDTWYCEIKETLKGNYPDETKEIMVVFFADTVKPGDECIVTVKGSEEDIIFSFVTKNSLRPVSEKAEIKGYVNK